MNVNVNVCNIRIFVYMCVWPLMCAYGLYVILLIFECAMCNLFLQLVQMLTAPSKADIIRPHFDFVCSLSLVPVRLCVYVPVWM